MSYEFIYEKEGQEQKLTAEMACKLTEYISNCYETWQLARSENLERSQNLVDEIFSKNNFLKNVKSENWKSKAKMNKVYMLYQTLKAYIWRNIYTTPNAMFDVSGENQESNSFSNRQKAAICDVLQKMNFSKVLDKIIDNSLLYGDMVAFVGWKKMTKQVRRPLSIIEKVLSAKPEEKSFVIEEVTTYDNPYVYEVNPVNFVFDTTQTHNWDACPKILKSFKTPEDILNNTLYKITPECKDFLTNLFKNGSQSKNYTSLNNQSFFKLKDEITNGDTVEVLEHWGDIRLDNGDLLKNMHIVVVGRKYTVRFEKNKFIENPFVCGHYLLDPDTKRAISPLQCIYELASMQENLYNKTLNMQALNENPPIYAPEGFFSEPEIKLAPGKIVTYDPNLFQNVPLTPMQFQSDIYLQDIVQLDNIIAEVSGIFPNMSGQLDRVNATATEISLKSQGQNIRLAMLLDILNQDLILPIIEKVAALLANFKFAPEVLFIDKDGKSDKLVIDNNVRQGHYQYTYSDRHSLLTKETDASQTALILEKFAKVMNLNWQEIFKWYWEQKGVDNCERFIQKQPHQVQLLPIVEELKKQIVANAMKDSNKVGETQQK